jgi:AcrR family transcriptional regulator
LSRDAGARRSWTARKSVQARQRIIDGALACFVEIGYHRTTMSEIARRAGVTRGSVQHHFSTTDEVLMATVDFVYRESLRRYQNLLGNLNGSNEELIERGVAALWEMMRDPLHVALQELAAAARTSATLRAVLQDVTREGERQYSEWALQKYPRFARFGTRDFYLARDFTRFFLEGLSRWSFEETGNARINSQLDLLKQMLRLYWAARPGTAVSTPDNAAAPASRLSSSQCHRLAELVHEAGEILGATGIEGGMPAGDSGVASGDAAGKAG